ncbi:hypothetical protein [Nocardiopsis alborubida]|uniref:Uncharacterized protein n=1 Tax=Nocardiopsis alborubida TaxID=146802 RepID=A0A7X6M8H6_9ACTN|nr:hypothetical protein [Nocardiopsis alborubida]NKY96389.1 hypothetical protein [Nocardiopsis alborubida]
MAWDRSQDAAQYEAARLLEQLHERWWVLWGPASRRFFAFHLGPHQVTPLRAVTPQLLDAAIRATERELRSLRSLRSL